MSAYYADDLVTLHLGDCLDVLPTIADASVDAVVCDPPYEIGMMGRSWDSTGIAYNVEVWRQCWRVLKPGGHLAAFGATRTYHRMAVAIEDAGFEIRDSLHWIYGCLDDQTEIMINGEWQPYHKAKEGSHALGYDAERDEFSWQPIQRVVVFPYSDTAFRLVGDHSDQLVTREHRCLVERDGSYVFQEAQEAARERQARVPVLEDVRALLNALPLPHQGAGTSQPHLLKGVRQPADGRGDDRAAKLTGESAAAVPGLRVDVPTLTDQAARGPRTGMFEAVPGGTGRRPSANGCSFGARGVDRCIESLVPGQDERAGEPWVEGRSDPLPQEGQLQGHQVRAVPGGVRIDGPQGRLRHGASAAGGPSDGQASDAAGSCASPGSRSSEQHPDESLAVQDQPGPQAVRGSRFTTADLVRIEPEHYDGTAWCVTVPTGAFVARRNGKVFVTGNSGFPKGQDIAKSIDRRRDDGAKTREVTAWLAAARDAAGWTNRMLNEAFGHRGDLCSHWTTQGKAASVPGPGQWARLRELLGFDDALILPLVKELTARKGQIGESWTAREVIGTASRVRRESDVQIAGLSAGAFDLTAPASAAALQWQGWNTSLKPAHEPIVLARKSTGFNTTVANVLEHGTGALNVDACRIVAGEDYREKCASVVGIASPRNGDTLGEWTGVREDSAHTAGRWPANVLLGHSPGCEADCQPGCPVAEMDSQSGVGKTNKPSSRGAGGQNGTYSPIGAQRDLPYYDDHGGASRFFPVFRYEAKAPASERPRLADGTAHTTVKPLALMQWLVRLITPPGGLVLDPFAGSGTTLEAAVIEGFRAVGVEQDPQHAALCVQRLSKPLETALFGLNP